MTFDTIRHEPRARIATITLARPDRWHAINLAMPDGIAVAVAAAEADDTRREEA